MTYEEWRSLAVACTDLRILLDIGDPYEYCDQPVPGVVFMVRVVEEGRTKRFDNVGFIQQYEGLWLVQICNIEKTFVDFEEAARYLWDEWVHDECFPDVDWNRPTQWSTGEELIVLDGPSFDGSLEVRAPKEFAIDQRVGSCIVNISTGEITGLMTKSHVELPKVINK